MIKFSLFHFHEVWNLKHHLFATILRRFSIPYIFSLHGHFDIWSLKKNFFLKKIFFFIFKKNFNFSSGLQISSLEEMKEAKFFLKNNINFFLISNGVDIKIDDININKNKLDSNIIKLLFFGRIHNKKGIELILFSLKKILSDKKNNFFNYKLSIIGPGDKYYLKKIKNLVSNLELNHFIDFSDPIYNEKDKINLLRSHDIFLLPSYEEANSIALKEALACGLPVIISKQCRLNEVETNNCGLIIQNNKIDDLSMAIMRMSDKKLLCIMSKNSSELIYKKYSSDVMNENFYEIYYDVMNGTRVAKNWQCNNYRP